MIRSQFSRRINGVLCMNRFACLTLFGLSFLLPVPIASCGGGETNSSPTTSAVTVTPTSGRIAAAQSLAGAIAVFDASGMPTGSVMLSSGSFTPSAATLNAGSASITVPAGSLAEGSDMLTAVHTPDGASYVRYNRASGTSSVPVSLASTAPRLTSRQTPPFFRLPRAWILRLRFQVAPERRQDR